MMFDHNEVQTLVKLAIRTAITELDLKHTEEVFGLRVEVTKLAGDIPKIIGNEIKACQRHQDDRRRWSIGTVLTVVGILMANALAIWATLRGGQ